jgi:hypothetical protein
MIHMFNGSTAQWQGDSKVPLLGGGRGGFPEGMRLNCMAGMLRQAIHYSTPNAFCPGSITCE